MLSTITKVILGPVLIVQGAYVRKRTERLPEPTGERQGTTGVGPPLRVLILGDSSAAGVGVATQTDAFLGQLLRLLTPTRTVTFRLVARTSETTASTLAMVKAIEPEPFDVGVIALGVNDLTRDISPARVLADRTRLHDCLRRNFNIILIATFGLPPVERFPALPWPLNWYLGWQARRLDSAVASWIASQPDCIHVPQGSAKDLMDPAVMARDGFHPGAPVYAHWASLMAPALQQRFPLPR